MASLDFFATRTDQKAIMDFLFTSTDVRIFELYSELGQEIREFRSFDELDAAFRIGIDQFGNGMAIHLQLWSPSVENGPSIERVNLNPAKCRGHTFRYSFGGWASIQLYFGGLYEQIITRSHLGHNTEIRARNWGYMDGVDWIALRKLSNKIQYHIRNRLAAARVPGRPVLAEAYGYARDGYELKESANASYAYELPPADPS